MKLLAVALAVILILLQYRIWVDNDGLRGVERLERAVAAQQKQNAKLIERNNQLAAQVKDPVDPCEPFPGRGPASDRPSRP